MHPTAERNAAIVAAYNAGSSTRAIAAVHGISAQRVSQIVRRAHPQPRTYRPATVRTWAATHPLDDEPFFPTPIRRRKHPKHKFPKGMRD